MKAKQRKIIFKKILDEELINMNILISEKEKMEFIKKTIQKWKQDKNAASVVS